MLPIEVGLQIPRRLRRWEVRKDTASTLKERGSTGLNTDQRGEYGKPCAVKVACTVWSGGKLVKAYLSLPLAKRRIKNEKGGKQKAELARNDAHA